MKAGPNILTLAWSYMAESDDENVFLLFFRCKLHTLEKKCSGGVEKLRTLLEELVLQRGLPLAELLEKSKCFLTLRRTLLSHQGYSKHARELLRLFPDADEDLAPLCC